MTNESELSTEPQDLVTISPKPGWLTSEGQIVAILTAALSVLAFLGFHFSPDQIQTWTDLVHQVFVILGPIVGIVMMVISYTKSRGIQKSNAINATALVNATALGGFTSSILGGKNWKDPSRYINILKTIGVAGVPGVSVITKALDGGGDDEFKQAVVDSLNKIDARLQALERR